MSVRGRHAEALFAAGSFLNCSPRSARLRRLEWNCDPFPPNIASDSLDAVWRFGNFFPIARSSSGAQPLWRPRLPSSTPRPSVCPPSGQTCAIIPRVVRRNSLTGQEPRRHLVSEESPLTNAHLDCADSNVFTIPAFPMTRAAFDFTHLVFFLTFSCQGSSCRYTSTDESVGKLLSTGRGIDIAAIRLAAPSF